MSENLLKNGDGYPKGFTDMLSWTGSDLECQPETWTEKFSAEDIAEIEAATKHFKSLGIKRGYASPTTFPLSEGLAARLREITDHVYNRLGVYRVQGLKPSLYTEEENVIMYAGITSYVADQRARHIDHIRDRTFANPRNEELRPLEQAVPMTFHTDVDTGDMLTMFVQSIPLEGGNQFYAPIEAVYNELLKTDPQVLDTLAEDWYWERIFRPGPDQNVMRVFNRPLIAYENGKLQVNFGATFVGGTPGYPLTGPEAPELSAEKVHALDKLQEVAGRVALRVVPEPGDLVFVNNYAILHARDSWIDSKEDPLKQRYILRLWLHDTEKGWESAKGLNRKLDEVFDLGPEEQGLMTGEEWQELPRGWRITQMGIHTAFCHA